LFALAIVPVIGGIGAAVGYSMASAYRTDMQKALDSTALALSKLLPMDEAKMNEVGLQYFLASMGQHDLMNLNLEIVPNNGKVTLRVAGDYTPKIANIFGATQFTIGTSSEAIWSMGKVEVALVLDSSLSMGQGSGRIEALRAATVDLLNVLQTAAKNPGDAKVGIVAFDGMVNDGSSNNNAAWLRWDWWDANVGSCNMNMGTVQAGTWLKAHCESRTSTSTGCIGANGNNQNQCQRNGGTWGPTTTNGVWTSTNRNQWAGCVYDRENGQWPSAAAVSYDVQDDAPNLTNPTLRRRCSGRPSILRPSATPHLRRPSWRSRRTGTRCGLRRRTSHPPATPTSPSALPGAGISCRQPSFTPKARPMTPKTSRTTTS
jgi:Flp pilus assembly protein TadG